MGGELIEGHIELAVLAVLSSLGAGILVLVKLCQPELLLTELAIGFFMELLLVLFLTVNVVHFPALPTFLDVSAAIAKMGGNF